MSIDELVKKLGYSSSPNFLTENEFGAVPGYSHLFQRGAAGRCRLRGVYTLKEHSEQSGAKPWTSPRMVDTQLRVYNHPGRSSNGENATHLHPRVQGGGR
jgi:hypothetical protein